MSVLDRIRRALDGRGPDAAELLDAAEAAALQITADGPSPALCGSSAHHGLVAVAEITGWRTPSATPYVRGRAATRPPRAAYCLPCAVLAYVGGAFMPDVEHTDLVREELARRMRRPQGEPIR